MIVFDATIVANPTRRSMEPRGFSSTVKALGLDLKQHNASDILRRGVVEMSSLGFCKSGRRGDRPWVQIPPARLTRYPRNHVSLLRFMQPENRTAVTRAFVRICVIVSTRVVTTIHRILRLPWAEEKRQNSTLMKTNIFYLLLIGVLACFWLAPQVRAVSPGPDGCYPGFTTAEGCNALQSLTTGTGNTGIGWYSLFSVGDEGFNTAVGAGTLVLNTADSNTAVGAAALLLNTTGEDNTAVGADALVHNVAGEDNTAVGAETLEFNDGTASNNTAVGAEALQFNTSGNPNTDVG